MLKAIALSLALVCSVASAQTEAEATAARQAAVDARGDMNGRKSLCYQRLASAWQGNGACWALWGVWIPPDPVTAAAVSELLVQADIDLTNAQPPGAEELREVGDGGETQGGMALGEGDGYVQQAEWADAIVSFEESESHYFDARDDFLASFELASDAAAGYAVAWQIMNQ